MKRLWLPLTLLALAACNDGVSTTLQLSNYDTSCTVDADCRAVFIGDACAASCQCPNAAINVVDLPREQSDLMAATALCSHSPTVCSVLCPEIAPVCSHGTCSLP